MPERGVVLLENGGGLFVELVRDEDLQAFLDRSVAFRRCLRHARQEVRQADQQLVSCFEQFS